MSAADRMTELQRQPAVVLLKWIQPAKSVGLHRLVQQQARRCTGAAGTTGHAVRLLGEALVEVMPITPESTSHGVQEPPDSTGVRYSMQIQKKTIE